MALQDIGAPRPGSLGRISAIPCGNRVKEPVKTLAELIFTIDVTCLLVLLAGAVWSVALPERRIWPPPGRRSWQYALTWVLFYAVFAANAALLVLDWNSWRFAGPLRWIVGLPVALLGGLLVSWGIATLGVRNTSGVAERFVSTGPYRFTRNPQYLGDALLFLGLSIVANSLLLWVTHALLVLVFAVTPLAEEPWLEGRYGEAYEAYERRTPRFL